MMQTWNPSQERFCTSLFWILNVFSKATILFKQVSSTILCTVHRACFCQKSRFIPLELRRRKFIVTSFKIMHRFLRAMNPTPHWPTELWTTVQSVSSIAVNQSKVNIATLHKQRHYQVIHFLTYIIKKSQNRKYMTDLKNNHRWQSTICITFTYIEETTHTSRVLLNSHAEITDHLACWASSQ